VGLSVQAATDKLNQIGISISIKGNGSTVTKQIPEAGTKLHKGSVVIAYTQEEENSGTTEVPSVVGMTYENALKAMENAGLVMEVDSPGSGKAPPADHIAITQSPQADSEVAEGTKIYVKFAARESD
jgi:stage V sporulation protein D (sporulation-specific penicillin-binding protein)